MIASLKRFLAPPVFADEEQTRKAALLNMIVLAAFVIATLYLLAAPLLLPEASLFWALVRYPVILFIWALLRLGYIDFACTFAISSAWVIQMLAWATTGGPRTSSLAGIIIFILMAGLLIGSRAAFLFAALSMVASLAMVYGESRGLLPKVTARYAPTETLIAQASWSFLAAVLLHLAMSNIKQALKQAHEELAERKRVEKELRASEERFAKAFNASPLPISIGREGRILDVNDTFVKVSGFSREEVVGHTVEELKILETPEDMYRMRRVLAEQGTVRNLDINLRIKSGELRANLLSVELIELEGEPCLLMVCNDYTERKHLEEQLRESQKLQAVGQLAGGVAHDFNNLLTVIIGFSELLMRPGHAAEPASLHNKLGMIKNAAERAAKLTHQLLAFSCQQVMEVKALSVNEVVTEILEMLEGLTGQDIELQASLDPSLKNVRADQGELEQVILNLAANARDAMPRGGKLIIETSNIYLDAAYAKRYPDITPGWYVMLAVSDTGIGMDDDTLEHIFEPFFTSRKKGKGVGLGLAMVHGVVKQSGGHITVYSELGHGTTFKIYLPLADAKEAESFPERKAITQFKGDETVLLVEDEVDIRQVAHEILEAQGYVVLEASGEESLSISEQYEGEIHLLVTDVVMPDINGQELAERLTVQRPNLKVLYMSGYTDKAIMHHGILKPNIAFLQKPFTPQALAEKVRVALNG
jgi:PAS domain S-box-containing protein